MKFKIKTSGTFKKKLKDIKKITQNKLEVVVGIPGDKNKKHANSAYTVAEIAALHEFGVGGQVERSFLRVPLSSNKKKYSKFAKGNISAVLAGNLAMDKYLGKLGALAQSDSVESFTNNDWEQVSDARLAQKTVGGKTGDKPLIDTGQLRQSITHEVRNK